MPPVLAVLEAFFVIAVVIGVGIIVGRTGVLGENARMVLNRVAFHIGVPALLLLNLSQATLGQIFSAPLLVAALAAASMFGSAYAIMVKLRKRGRGDAVIAAWTSSYVNAGNLGIPLSAYVFGDTTVISAIILFQSVVLAPVGIAILNSETTPQRSAREQVVTLLRNPIIAASAIGVALAAFGLDIPQPLVDPLQLLADLAIPTVILAFGISLSSRLTDAAPSSRLDVALVVTFKIVLMPLTAYAVGRWVFELDAEPLVIATVLSALPSAQNINTYAAIYKRNETMARNATVVSTLVAVPIIVAVVALLGN